MRDELIVKSGQFGGGAFTRALEELIASGFVSKYRGFGKKSKQTLFRLSDEYTRFYLQFIEPNKNQGDHFWKTMFQKQSYISWAGFNFETICLKHIQQIKKALKIEGIHSVHSAWSNETAQVDLVIKRADRWVNLCEMKFHTTRFQIDKKGAENLRNKVDQLKKEIGPSYAVTLTFITTFGIVENSYYHELVENEFTMEILFDEIS
ncbi:MAG: hypothetical protein E6Q37_04725 [Crocinitomicaceae bacterium]|nr:MAG: hypothetical protein E6Q37_04725 [Crocinitomicaceae bacterium]